MRWYKKKSYGKKHRKKDWKQQLSADSKTTIESDYNSAIDYIKKQYTSVLATASPTTTASVTSTPGVSDEDSYIDQYFAGFGFTRDGYKKYIYVNEYTQMLKTQVEAEITDVSDEDLKAAYETELNTQKDAFDKAEKVTATSTSSSTTSTTSYEYYSENGKVIVYVPSGLAYYKHILIKIPDSYTTQIKAVDSENLTDDQKTAKKAELTTEAYASIKTKADEVLAKVKSGEDFDALMAQYGEDTGMQSGAAKETGYLVGKQSSYVTEFLNACFSLTNVGDTSELYKPITDIQSSKSIRINTRRYPYDQVKDALKTQVLTTKKTEHWDSTLETWKTDLKYPYIMIDFTNNKMA